MFPTPGYLLQVQSRQHLPLTPSWPLHLPGEFRRGYITGGRKPAGYKDELGGVGSILTSDGWCRGGWSLFHHILSARTESLAGLPLS